MWIDQCAFWQARPQYRVVRHRAQALNVSRGRSQALPQRPHDAAGAPGNEQTLGEVGSYKTRTLLVQAVRALIVERVNYNRAQRGLKPLSHVYKYEPRPDWWPLKDWDCHAVERGGRQNVEICYEELKRWKEGVLQVGRLRLLSNATQDRSVPELQHQMRPWLWQELFNMTLG